MPIMLALIALGPLLIPESKDPNPGRFDIPSAVLSMLALVPFVYAVKEIAAHGRSPATLVAAVVGVSAGVLFVRRQRTLERPMLDLRLFAVPQFRVAVVTNLLAVFALAGVLFFGSQYVQLVLGHSPLQAGMLLLPGMVASVVGSLLAAVLVRWWRPTSVLGGSLAMAALGSALFLWLTADATGMAPFVLGFGLIGTGVGIALTVSSDLVVSSAPAERAGAAAAISETAYETGIALGVAVLGSIVMAVFRNGIDVSALPADAAGTAVESLGGVADLAGQLPEAAGASLLGSEHESFVTGIHLASVGIAGILLVAAVVAFRSRAARS
jgi:DHA2 family multidrug resistance protein-like MFS transporter